MMLRRFKTRTLLLQVGMTSAILFLALLAVYVMVEQNWSLENRSVLESLAGQTGTYVQGEEETEPAAESEQEPAAEEKKEPAAESEKEPAAEEKERETTGENGSGQEALQPMRAVSTASTGEWFQADLKEDGSVGTVLGDAAQEDRYRKAAGEAVRARKDRGTIHADGRTWLYQISRAPRVSYMEEDGIRSVTAAPDPSESFLTCLDITEGCRQMRRLGLLFLLTGAAGFAAICAVSAFFTNRFLRPVQLAWEGQKRFIADASHELKTPLSIVNANVDVLRLDPEASVGSQEKWLRNICMGTDRMKKLVEEMLLLSRTEEGAAAPGEVKAANVSRIFERAADGFEAALLEKQVTLFRDILPDAVCNTDADILFRLLCILCENAVSYTPEGGEIVLSLKRERGKLVLCVKNSGSPIPKEDLPHLFERFYRGRRQREEGTGAQGTGNFGLGLAIAGACAERLGGKLCAGNDPDGRPTLCFTIREGKS